MLPESYQPFLRIWLLAAMEDGVPQSGKLKVDLSSNGCYLWFIDLLLAELGYRALITAL